MDRSYRIVKKVVHGQLVDVKVYRPVRRPRGLQVTKVRGDGAYRRGALQAAVVSGKKVQR